MAQQRNIPIGEDRLYRKIHQLIEDDDDANCEELVKLAGEVLKTNKKDADARSIQLVSYIRLGEFEKALQICRELPKGRCGLEHAYSLYRQNKLEECQQIIADHKNDSQFYHLQAQVNFRQNEFEQAAKNIEACGDVEGDLELVSNLIAALTSAGKINEGDALAQKYGDSDAYEVLFNAACGHIQNGDYKKAREYVVKATEICRQTLKENEYTDAEIRDELASLTAQISYLDIVEGNATQAHQSITEALADPKPSDAQVVAVLSNNLVALRKKDEKIFDSMKRSDRCQKVQPHKLSPQQHKVFTYNRCLLLLFSKKLDKCVELVETAMKRYPDEELFALVLAAVKQREQKNAKCEAVLKKRIEAFPNDSLQSQLTLVHVQLLTGKRKEAIDTLKSIKQIQYYPATVATLEALSERAGDQAGAMAVFDDAIKNFKGAPEASRALREQYAQYKMKHGQEKDALAMYDSLSKETKDPIARGHYLSQLVKASALTDPKLAVKYAKQLPPLDGLDSIDVAAIEARAAPRAPVQTSRKDDEVKEEAPVKKKRKNKKKKKIRYPKDYDPSQKPDPERWLPRWERSYYKKSKSRRRREQTKGGAQGSVPVSEPEPTREPEVKKSVPRPSTSSKKKKGRKKRR